MHIGLTIPYDNLQGNQSSIDMFIKREIKNSTNWKTKFTHSVTLFLQTTAIAFNKGYFLLFILTNASETSFRNKKFG